MVYNMKVLYDSVIDSKFDHIFAPITTKLIKFCCIVIFSFVVRFNLECNKSPITFYLGFPWLHCISAGIWRPIK